jgi:transcriptional regulator GlxA family with amidase domain
MGPWVRAASGKSKDARRLACPRIPPQDDFTDPAVCIVMEFLMAHYADRITVRDLARRAGVSRSALCRRFRSATGFSLHARLRLIRLREARELLATTPMIVMEVAAAVGYRGAANFTRAFSRFQGQTPTEYRASHRAPGEKRPISPVRRKELDDLPIKGLELPEPLKHHLKSERKG